MSSTWSDSTDYRPVRRRPLRLTRRGEFVVGCVIALVLLVLPGIAGWIGYLITGVAS